MSILISQTDIGNGFILTAVVPSAVSSGEKYFLEEILYQMAMTKIGNKTASIYRCYEDDLASIVVIGVDVNGHRAEDEYHKLSDLIKQFMPNIKV